MNHLRSEKEMGPSELSKRLLGPLLADRQVSSNNPRNNCGPHISAPVPFSCLKWRMRTIGYFVLFDFIQLGAVVTCHKHGISALVPQTLCRGDSFAAQLNATP